MSAFLQHLHSRFATAELLQSLILPSSKWRGLRASTDFCLIERKRKAEEREREREASATILPSGGTLLPMLWAELFFVHV